MGVPLALSINKENTMIQCCNKYILLKDANEEKTRNGVIIPKGKTDYDIGIVVDSETYKKGEKLITHFHCGNPFEWEGEKYYIVHEEYIHGKITD